MATVYVIKCNDATEFIVDAVAYDSLLLAEKVQAEIDGNGYNSVCGPHAVYPLRLRTEGD